MIGKRLVVTEEIERAVPAARAPRDQAELEELVEESGDRFTRKRLVRWPARARSARSALALVAPALSLGPVLRHRVVRARRRGGADGGSSTRTAGPLARRATSRKAPSTPRTPRAPTASSSARRSSSCGCRRRARAARRPRTGGRRRASSPTRRSARTPAARSSLYRTPTFPPAEPRPGARLPLPLLDVRPGDRRHGPLRPGRARAAAAAARGRRAPGTCARPATSAARSARRGGACGKGRSRRDPRRRPLPRRRARRRAVRCGRRCATSSPTTGRSCSARSRCTRSSCSSRPAST